MDVFRIMQTSLLPPTPVYFENETDDDFGECATMNTSCTTTWFKKSTKTDLLVKISEEGKEILWNTDRKDDGALQFTTKESVVYVPIRDVIFFA